MVVIGVTGVTGLQGGAVANSFKDNGHTIIGITRNKESDAAKRLNGIELKQADFDDVTSLNGIFDGCDVVFLVTNFWEHMDPEREFKQAKNIIDSAMLSNVPHIIWSTLEDTRVFNDSIPYIGNYKVPHLDEKGMVSKYLDTLDVKSTHLYTSFFYENLLTSMKLKKDEDGIRRLCVPMGDSILPIVAVEDIGKMALHCVEKCVYGNVGVASQHLKVSDMASILTDVLQEPVQYVPVPASVYRTFGFPGCNDLANMFEFKDIHNKSFCEQRNMEIISKRIIPITFNEWCLNNKAILIN
tara:strand:- start:213 stop:1106 length:894 start_codon:yes stop_codon:yes gene_type:complete